jgi:hypothetical protein
MTDGIAKIETGVVPQAAVSADDLLRKAIELGDRQVDELARLARLSSQYRTALFRALHHARYGQTSRVIEVLEQGLERDRAPP